MPKPLTSAQVAAQLGISTRAVQALAKRRGYARVGRDWLFSPAQVQSLSTPLTSGPKPGTTKGTTVKIEIDGQIIHTRIDEPAQLAFERTIHRIYGAKAWFRPELNMGPTAGRWRGEYFDGYGQVFKSLPGGSATSLTERIRVTVGEPS